MDPRLFFLVGTARSGTTALWRVLSAHPEIVLGCERYKRIYSRRRFRELEPEHFTDAARFFDFNDGLTNITPDREPFRTRYAEMESRFDRARYVGDKMTQVRIQAMGRALPDPRFLGIVRPLMPTAASWQFRATNPTDRWFAEKDANASIEVWHDSLRKLVRNTRAQPDRVQFVELESFFGDPEAVSLRRVLDWMGLEAEPAVLDAFAQAHEHYVGGLNRRVRELPSEVRDHIETNLDEALWRRARRLAL